MSRLHTFISPLIVLAQVALWLAPCPQAPLPSAATWRAPAESARSHPAPAAAKADHSHHHAHGTHGAAAADVDSGHADHRSASALEKPSEQTLAVLGIPCPCGCSRRSETGRAPLSVGDYLPAESPTLNVSWSRPAFLGWLVQPPLGPVFRVFHVPLSA